MAEKAFQYFLVIAGANAMLLFDSDIFKECVIYLKVMLIKLLRSQLLFLCS